MPGSLLLLIANNQTRMMQLSQELDTNLDRKSFTLGQTETTKPGRVIEPEKVEYPVGDLVDCEWLSMEDCDSRLECFERNFATRSWTQLLAGQPEITRRDQRCREST